MPDLVTDKNSSEANEKHPKKGSLGKYKWYIVGALAVIAVLVFYFTRNNSSNSSSAAGTSQAGIDPSTGIPYASEYGAGGAYGIPGPAGPTGATGARGRRGERGKTGKRGGTHPTHHHKKDHDPRPHRHKGGGNHTGTQPRIPHIGVSSTAHPALKLAAAHRGNSQRAA